MLECKNNNSSNSGKQKNSNKNNQNKPAVNILLNSSYFDE